MPDLPAEGVRKRGQRLRPNLDVQLLRTFVTIAEEGSLRKAADQLLRSPAAISLQIKKLEETLEVALFERAPQGLVPTFSGARLAEAARKFIAQHDAFLDVCGSYTQGLPALEDYEDTTRVKSAASMPAGPSIAKPMIAVMPFVNMSGDPEQNYLTDGITEDIITDLSKVSALTVVPRHGAFSMRGAAPGDVATKFHANYLLQGSVRRSGGRVRITAELTDTNETHIWSDRYDGTLEDIFKLQDRISRNIVDELRLKLLPHESAILSKRPTADANAYQMYLLGRSFFNRGLEARNLLFARHLFAKALEIDPNYAKAYAGMANCDSYLFFSNNSSVSFETIMENCAKALALDNNLADAHASRGLALLTTSRNKEAGQAFERALELDPSSYEAHYFYGQNCYAVGDYERAASLFERAATLLPSDYQAPTMYAAALLAMACDDKAMAAAQEALRRIEREVSTHPDNANAYCFGAIELAVLGETDRALTWAAHAGSLAGSDDYLVLYNLACCYARLGKREEAIDSLERQAFGVPIYVAFNLKWMKNDSDLAVIQDHPRFLDLVDRLERQLDEATIAKPDS